MTFDRLHDARVRGATFDWLSTQVDVHGDVLPRAVLAEGFQLDGQRVPLLGPQGIFKPRIMDLPLSFTTAPRGPYDDGFGADDLLEYRYRGTDPDHRDNVGLRRVAERRLPLVYFHGVVPGKYLAAWPVFVVGDHPERLTFSVQVDDADHLGLNLEAPLAVHGQDTVFRRRYETRLVRRRLHQQTFRERVLAAYRSECSFCHFRHSELLDAAHIIADAHELGEPRVTNGIALCRFHHGAFDRGFLGVRPDYVIEVRPDLLEEEDGPTLVHSIQALHRETIRLPRNPSLRPAPERLEQRYAEFLRGSRAS